MKNPRSALCKTSVMASADIFKAFGDELFESSTSDAFDDVVSIVFIELCLTFLCSGVNMQFFKTDFAAIAESFSR